MRNFSTNGYNFTFKFNAKDALDVLTNPDQKRPIYDPSSPTQTDDKNEAPDNMDIAVLKDTNPEHNKDKTNNVNNNSIEELIVSDDENPTNNDKPTIDGATSLDYNNANDTRNEPTTMTLLKMILRDTAPFVTDKI